MSAVPLPDFKAHINDKSTGGADDAEQAVMLEAAEEVVIGIIGPIEPTQVTEVHRARVSFHQVPIVLRQGPAIELVSISSGCGSTSTPLTLTDFQLDTSTGTVWSANGGSLSGDFTVTYMAGFTVMPAAVRLAILIIAGHLWKTTQRGGGSVRPSFPGEGDQDPGPTAGAGYLIPNRARELLARYEAWNVGIA